MSLQYAGRILAPLFVMEVTAAIRCRTPYINYLKRALEWEVAMFKRFFLVALSGLMITGSASADQLSVAPTPASFPAFGPDGAMSNFSPLVKPVVSYCRRDCTWCRNDCYNTYRVYCYGPSCRRQFTLCMRGCWYNICKWC